MWLLSTDIPPLLSASTLGTNWGVSSPGREGRFNRADLQHNARHQVQPCAGSHVYLSTHLVTPEGHWQGKGLGPVPLHAEALSQREPRLLTHSNKLSLNAGGRPHPRHVLLHEVAGRGRNLPGARQWLWSEGGNLPFQVSTTTTETSDWGLSCLTAERLFFSGTANKSVFSWVTTEKNKSQRPFNWSVLHWRHPSPTGWPSCRASRSWRLCCRRSVRSTSGSRRSFPNTAPPHSAAAFKCLHYNASFTSRPRISTTRQIFPAQRHFMRQDLPSAKAGGESLV